MNQEIRNRLRNVVTQCRKLLEDSVSQELEGKYGIFSRKDKVTADPNAPVAHLTQDEQAARTDILDHFGHIQARGFKPREALDQLVRETAFTHLNRFCAYKMMEAREVYIGEQKFREAVSRGIKSNGFLFYLGMDGHEADERLYSTGQQDQAYRHFLDWLGGLLSDEIGVLFNPHDPANCLYPRQTILDKVLNLLNDGGIKPEETELKGEWPNIWLQDETIGWVYQYFTPKELRDQARKESQVPRNSYELAFRNQFFTPRYVVEFLTDNTLGRIWYEMRKGDTKLKYSCRYLVQRPGEIFLSLGDLAPEDEFEDRTDFSQEELLTRPMYVPHRPKKDPRELKVLDPASGSGHFLLYCFDLLETIYEEAYSDPDIGPELKNDYKTLNDLRRQIPRLILAHNLHGIDIDIRASQIAALALWLRSQRAYQEMGLRKERPRITRSNLVCAEAMPGEGQMLKEFVEQLEPRLLGQVVEVIFDKMKSAGEAGSLLKIEENIRDTVTAARKQWVRETTQATDRKGQSLLFTQTAMDQLAGKPEQPPLFDLSDVTDDQFFEQAEFKVIEALREYAENGQRLQRRLFAEDAVRGFAFVDVCQKRFDVVLMNPPFGSATGGMSEELGKQYPQSAKNLFAMFVIRANALSASGGVVGALTPRTFLTLASFENYRTFLLNKEYSLGPLADLGWEVLDDAQVETCAFIMGLVSPDDYSPFFNLSDERPNQRAQELIQQLTSPSLFRPFIIATKSFVKLPKRAFSYRLPVSVFSAYLRGDIASKTFYSVFEGAAITGADRFHRLWWEVSCNSLQETWFPLAHGGEFAPYFRSIVTVINWQDDGRGPKEEVISRYPYFNGNYGLKIKHEDLYFKRGLSYGKRTDSLNVSVMPDGCVFSHEAQAVFLKDHGRWRECLAFLNSAPARYCANQICEGHKLATYISSLPCSEALVEALSQHNADVDVLVEHRQGLAKTDETSRDFCSPALLYDRSSDLSLTALATSRIQGRLQKELKLIGMERSISDVVDSHLNTAELRGLTVGDTSISIHDRQDPTIVDVTMRNGYLASACSPATLRMLESSEFAIGEDVTLIAELENAISEFLSYLVGSIFGRWDIRLVYEPDSAIRRQSVFEALPVCSPGMLQKDRDVHEVDSSALDYPVSVDWEGILVDSADHENGITSRVQALFELMWSAQADVREQEACKILGAKNLREYFRRVGKGGFWSDHIARYTVSRRKAPIYWLLQSARGNYSIWLYYHRLDKDLLFKVLVKYVEPKIRLVSGILETLHNKRTEAGQSGKGAKRLAVEIESQNELLSELIEFEDKIRRAANLHLVPDLNDGVMLNIAALWELVPWKEAKNYWDELLDGEYEWSSISQQLHQKGLVK